jgi:hypothetical protein
LRQAEEHRARTRKGLLVGLLVGVLALVLLWNTGRMDPWLSGIGLNKNTCVKNGFGATFCGDAADEYQRNVAELQSSLGSLGFSSQAADDATMNVRAAIPAVEAYYADNNTYAGMSLVALRLIDSSIALTAEPVVSASGQQYCIESTVASGTYSYRGPGIDSAPLSGSC